MVNSSPVPPHELHDHALIGEITTSSVRVLATTKNVRTGLFQPGLAGQLEAGAAADMPTAAMRPG
jgi:hypothetical protein